MAGALRALKWHEFGVKREIYYAWENAEKGYQASFRENDIGYQISTHEDGSGYQLRIYRIEPGVPSLFYEKGLSDLQAAKDAAEQWRRYRRTLN